MGLVLVLACLLLIGLVAYAGVAARGYFDVQDTRTPALAGLSYGEASRLAEEAGLELRSYPSSVTDMPPETVTEQSPPAGAVVRIGRTVSVGVNVPGEADRMPTLTGLQESDAVTTLRELALPAPDVAYAFDERPAGSVIEQAPAAGGEVPRGDAVRLTVSRGSGPVAIELPDLTGVDVESARSQLSALGVRRIETVPVSVSMLRAGAVTQQRPAAGTVVNAGEPVTLGYALEGERIVEVPEVAGMEPWRARTTLRAAGLSVGPVEVVQRDDAAEGVVGTRPEGLTAAGAPVILVVNAAAGTEVDVGSSQAPSRFGDGGVFGDAGGSDGPGDDASPGDAADFGPGGRTVPFRFDPAEVGVRSLLDSDYSLRLVVNDDRGERTAIEEDVEAGEAVRASVRVFGDEPLLQTYVNGVFFQAWRP